MWLPVCHGIYSHMDRQLYGGIASLYRDKLYWSTIARARKGSFAKEEACVAYLWPRKTTWTVPIGQIRLEARPMLRCIVDANPWSIVKCAPFVSVEAFNSFS